MCLELPEGQAVHEAAAAVVSEETARQRLELKRRKFSEGRCVSSDGWDIFTIRWTSIKPCA